MGITLTPTICDRSGRAYQYAVTVDGMPRGRNALIFNAGGPRRESWQPNWSNDLYTTREEAARGITNAISESETAGTRMPGFGVLLD
jgi:hypothetical protein